MSKPPSRLKTPGPKWLFTFTVLLLGSHIGLAAPAPKISYTVSLFKTGDYKTFLIRLTLKGSPSGKTTLSIPYETGLYRPQDHVAVKEVSNSTNHHYAAGDSSLYVIEHKPNAPLALTYTITNALQDSLPTEAETSAQMLTDKYFYVMGTSLWVIPCDSTPTPYDISVTWKAFPPAWTFLNSYDAKKASQRMKIPLNHFLEAIYMGGDIRVHKLMIHDRPLYLGIRGQWSFNDSEVLRLVEKTVRAQRAYWNDYDVDRYTVALIPMKYGSEGEKSMTGRGLRNTFVTVGTNSKAFGLEDMTYLYNHELMHHWLGQVLQQGEPENAFKWFHEGFTDYFAYTVMREGGLLDEANYRQQVNRIFSAYYSDSSHQWPNTKLQQDYWASPQMQKLPYQRGHLFALYLDESIRFHTQGVHSLKEVVQQMLTGAHQQKRVFSPAWLLELLQTTTGKDYAPLLERFITQGSFISIADWQAVSGKVALLPTEVFALGFATDKGIALNARITAVDEGSPVAKAGLRAGDVLTGFSSTGQATEWVTMTVKRGEEKIKLRYLPSRPVWVPQLK